MKNFCTLCTCISSIDILKTSTWNDLFCSCVDDVSIWWQMLIFVSLCPKRWFQFNSAIVSGTHFSSIMTSSNWKMIAEPQSYIFRWGSWFRRRHVCLKNLTQPMCIASVDTISRHFQGPRKYGIYQYLQEIRFPRLIGSLSNHDDDGSENVIWKCHFAFLQSFFSYSKSLCLKNVF